ncbi:aldo/keto reductase [Subtercola endophyticus]|uniref:aldo/keto reductase n=1 Tax=Subtercola endophyticus TaxID=2895559 RepID=UPI001E2F3C39|nr:aldo/keto reductase [Subtercola endophyticus]UFS58772.1 aldo/keto reductase [Subtercola endophyticus]
MADHGAEVTLNSGERMPLLGFGTWEVGREGVAAAARAGYRAFDTATFYFNEAEVAAGILEAGMNPAEMFLTTKIARPDMSYEGTFSAWETSRTHLGVDVIDLYLIHWPQWDERMTTETWKAMEKLLEQGKVNSIGVSNFEESDLDLLASHFDVTPAVNQILLHPLQQRPDLVSVNAARGIATSAWSPLGGNGSFFRNEVLTDPTLLQIAATHGVTVAQVVLRWMRQSHLIAVPRSNTPSRISQNIDLDGFELAADELVRIDDLNRPYAGGLFDLRARV